MLIGPCSNSVLANGVRALTLPSVSYSSVAGSLGVVWHQAQTGWPCATLATTPYPSSDIYYSHTDGASWLAPVGIATTANNDEYMPSVTADDTGLFAIPYYKNDVANNRYFTEFWTLRTATGAVAIENHWLYPLSSDPYGYNTIYPNFIGDYQGVTNMVHQDQGRREYWPAWVRINSSQNPPRGDIWITDVLP